MENTSQWVKQEVAGIPKDRNGKYINTGLTAYSDTPATVTGFWAQKGSLYAENHEIQ